MKLVDHVVKSFRVAKVFNENADRINNIDFASNGETLISSSDDDSIVIYDCERGTHKKTLHSKKYGVDLIRYTHAANTAIHCSTKVDGYQYKYDVTSILEVVWLLIEDELMYKLESALREYTIQKSEVLPFLSQMLYFENTIRYLSLHDNKYIRYFPGHTKKVVVLSMSPADDTFLSGSLDKTIRLWDLRSPNCQGLMHLSGRPVGNFDPDGVIFAVGINSETVKLYDLRSFDKGPFNTFKLAHETGCDWTGLKFSPDGKTILISTNGQVIHLIDAFGGAMLQTFTDHVNNISIALEASFSPDSQFVFSGSTDGQIHVWNAETGVETAILNCEYGGPLHCVQFNPKFMMLASACTNMAFWLPTIEDGL